MCDDREPGEELGKKSKLQAMGKSMRKVSERRKGVYFDIRDDQIPIIYSPNYNIHFLGMEKLHPFDSAKWGKIFAYLEAAKIVTKQSVVEPQEASEKDLLVVHTPAYLNKLKWSPYVATVTEVPFVAMVPNFLVQRSVLKPFRFQTAGTIQAGKLAVERGWAINLGGGFHHCSSDRGGGFCAYADITLCIRFLFDHISTVSSAMIVDLDAHQGNGHERDFLGDRRVYILDIYNRMIYPQDEEAKQAIDRNVGLKYHVEDAEYLEKVTFHLEEALNEFQPDVIIYNAGTDILEGDCLGNLSISAQGIVTRDEIVFSAARTRSIPIVMVTSGGYQKRTARVVAESIINLHQKGLIN